MAYITGTAERVVLYEVRGLYLCQRILHGEHYHDDGGVSLST